MIPTRMSLGIVPVSWKLKTLVFGAVVVVPGFVVLPGKAGLSTR